jgi:hypothetical protein
MATRSNKIIIGLTAAIAVLGCAGVLTSCSSSTDSAEVSAPVETDVPQTTETSAEPVTTVASAEETTTVPASTESTTELNIAGGNDPEDSLMPDVVCMNLQEAQDEIQDHGVFFSRSVDASGQDRMQIMDSNWIVVDQTPAPGAEIGEGDAVLSVVKIGESTGGVC